MVSRTDDGRADRNRVVDSRYSQRNQQRQRRFRTVSCRTQRIQTKDRNTRNRCRRVLPVRRKRLAVCQSARSRIGIDFMENSGLGKVEGGRYSP